MGQTTHATETHSPGSFDRGGLRLRRIDVQSQNESIGKNAVNCDVASGFPFAIHSWRFVPAVARRVLGPHGAKGPCYLVSPAGHVLARSTTGRRFLTATINLDRAVVHVEWDDIGRLDADGLKTFNRLGFFEFRMAGLGLAVGVRRLRIRVSPGHE